MGSNFVNYVAFYLGFAYVVCIVDTFSWVRTNTHMPYRLLRVPAVFSYRCWNRGTFVRLHLRLGHGNVEIQNMWWMMDERATTCE